MRARRVPRTAGRNKRVAMHIIKIITVLGLKAHSRVVSLVVPVVNIKRGLSTHAVMISSPTMPEKIYE